MTDCIGQMSRLLGDMEQALLANDVEGVREITAKQSLALQEIVQAAKSDATVKAKLHQVMPSWTEQQSRIDVLLEQGMATAHQMILACYGAESNPQRNVYEPSMMMHRTVNAKGNLA